MVAAFQHLHFHIPAVVVAEQVQLGLLEVLVLGLAAEAMAPHLLLAVAA